MTNFEPLLENTSQEPLVKELENTLYNPFIYSGHQLDMDLRNYSVMIIHSIISIYGEQ